MKRTLLSFCAAALFASCTTTSNQTLPAAVIATSAVLVNTKPEARQGAAVRMVALADGLALITSEATTGADITNLALGVFGSDEKFAPYAVTLGVVFDTYKAEINAKNVAGITNVISAGIKLAATPYL